MESVPAGSVFMSGVGGGILVTGSVVDENTERVPAGSVAVPVTVINVDGEPVRE